MDWLRVEDRMPEAERPVLWLCEDGTIFMDHIEKDMDADMFLAGVYDPITHWCYPVYPNKEQSTRETKKMADNQKNSDQSLKVITLHFSKDKLQESIGSYIGIQEEEYICRINKAINAIHERSGDRGGEGVTTPEAFLIANEYLNESDLIGIMLYGFQAMFG